MIAESAPDGGVGSKKRFLTSPGVVATCEQSSEKSIMSPPFKKLKQARLPFKVISSPSPNQCSKSPATDPLPSKKRKLSGSERIPASSQPKAKSSDGKLSSKKPADNLAKKFFTKRVSASPVTPKKSRIEMIDLEPEVTSSCEDQEAGKAASSSTTPRRSLSSKPKSLDSFLQTTQQPQVSTSDDIHDISDDEINEAEPSDIKETQYATHSDNEVTVVTVSSENYNSEVKKQDLQYDLDVKIATMRDDSNAASKLSYDADSEDGNDDEDMPRTCKSSEGSSEAESSTGGPTSKVGSITPKGAVKPMKKTPLSAKALKKLQEMEEKRDVKIKLRMDKKRKLEEEEAERKRLKLELRKVKEREQDEARRQKEAEKDEKNKEKQQKKEMEEKEKEQKKVAKEEDRKKKQEIIDAKIEEKRKKFEERQRQEDEKRQEEDEKREKQAKQKSLFKSFFKEAVVPVKKHQDKSCGWFAPFQVKEHMVLAPLRRSDRLLETSKEFETAFQIQNSSSLYLDELRDKVYTAGKMGRTSQAKPEEEECISRTTTPSVEIMQQVKDSQDVEIVSELPTKKPAKKLVRTKCKLLQFHENYRPAYYGTWRRGSKAINPRNFLKKDEDLLDYDVDSDDEWEEPGESLSHSEGEEDGEDVEDAGDSDDGFFVPHGYLSESEGCEDEEEAENWKERRAAKAKSWEAELKRQQGVLKPVLVGCVWEINSKMTANKMLDAYKIIAMATVPIDTRSRKQIMASSETLSREDLSKSFAHTKGSGADGVSLKRPVPAEAMPDLIRLVHGNTAGIRTLQREFREYWRLKDLSRKSGRSTPRPETPSTISGAEINKEKSSLEVSQISGDASLFLSGSVVDVAEVVTVKPEQIVPTHPSPQSAAKNEALGGDAGTPESSKPGQTSPINSSGQYIECSISKRQLMLTITAIAVRERRPAFPRTCWYVHQHLLEKHRLQNLPIPCQWQNITKPQKALRAESPHVGSSLSVFGNQTPISYTVSSAGGLPMIIQQNQMPHSLNPALHASPNSLIHVPQPSGSPYHTHVRLQENTVAQNLAAARSNVINPLTGVNMQQAIQQPGSVSLPFQLQLSNGMSACEIMQRLSATVPIQHVGTPAVPSSSLQTHIFNPINNQMHYLNVLPKPGIVPYTANAPIVGQSSTSQNRQADTSHAMKIPHTSPTDIKAMLSSQASKLSTANPTNITKQPDSSYPSLVSQAVIAPSCGSKKPPTPVIAPSCGSKKPPTPVIAPSCGSKKPPTPVIAPSCGSKKPPTPVIAPSCGSKKPPTPVIVPSCGSKKPPTPVIVPSCGSKKPPTPVIVLSCGSKKPPTPVIAPGCGSKKLPTPAPNCQESLAAPSVQQPSKKSATLKSFFNVSVKPLPKSQPNQTEICESSSVSKKTILGLGDTKEVSVSKDPVQAVLSADSEDVQIISVSYRKEEIKTDIP